MSLTKADNKAETKWVRGTALLGALNDCTGFAFTNVERVERALTHASARNNPKMGAPLGDYERLEFLGDRVLGLAVAEMLFKLYPEADEGEMSVRLNALVRMETLADLSDEIGLTPYIRTGLELAPRAARKQRNLKADVMEALIASIYLEGGMKAASEFIEKFWGRRAKQAAADKRDAKTQLQEWAHQQWNVPPSYEIISRDGPDHAPIFVVRVSVAGGTDATGQGRSKREAEQLAAEKLLIEHQIWSAS